jgi:hypothetical protein
MVVSFWVKTWWWGSSHRFAAGWKVRAFVLPFRPSSLYAGAEQVRGLSAAVLVEETGEEVMFEGDGVEARVLRARQPLPSSW